MFGHSKFREYQLEIMMKILQGQDVFCMMATGAGKSLTFQLPAVTCRRHGMLATSIVISPLLSLIEDQVMSLMSMGISAVAIGGGATREEEEAAMKGAYSIIYATPEKISIWKHGISELAKKVRIVNIAIDESHCLSEWGHDFRPHYRQTGQLRSWLPTVPILALTATATPSVQADIVSNLRLRDPLIVRTPFNRTNLKYTVLHRTCDTDLIRVLLNMQSIYEQSLYHDDDDEESDTKGRATLEKIAGSKPKTRSVATATMWSLDAENPEKKVASEARRKGKPFQSSLVYVSSKKEAERLCKLVQDCSRFKGVKVAFYHAGMSVERRCAVHRQFLLDEVHIVVATVAFGMGINKTDIRLVVHFSLPQSIEGYYQQTGRAGRDGERSQCVMLFHRNDISRCYQIGSSGTVLSSAFAQAMGKSGITKELPSLSEEEVGIATAYLSISSSFTNSSTFSRGATSGDEVLRNAYANMIAAMKEKLNSQILAITDYARGKCRCRRSYLLSYFGEHCHETAGTRKEEELNDTYNELRQFCCDMCEVEMKKRKMSKEQKRQDILVAAGQAPGAEKDLLALGTKFDDGLREDVEENDYAIEQQYEGQLIDKHGLGQNSMRRRLSNSRERAEAEDIYRRLGCLVNPPNVGGLGVTKVRDKIGIVQGDDDHVSEEKLDSLDKPPVNSTLETNAVTGLEVDVGPEISMLLRAIRDTGEFFGLGVPIGVLIGSHDKNVQRIERYSDMTVFGLGARFSRDWWKALAFQMHEREGLLGTELIRGQSGSFAFSRYFLTKKARDWLSRGASKRFHPLALRVWETDSRPLIHLQTW